MQEPLRTISAFTQLFEARYLERLDAEASELLENIRSAAQRLTALINSLLTYARVGGEYRTWTPIDCQAVLQGTLRDLESTIQESGAEIVSHPLPKVFGDRTQIAQVFQNLIGNSIKYRSPVRPLHVDISSYEEEDHWVIWVKDNGVGFDPKQADRIFRVFTRLHGGEISGTGIGLTLCKKIVESHGGRIWAESTPGQGSTFAFTLPMNAAAAHKRALVAHHPR